MSAAIERAAARAAEAAAIRLAEALRDELGGAAVGVSGATVIVTGRGLRDTAALRWPGRLLR